MLGELSGDRAAASAAADAAIAPHRPQELGWFLETVGTAPEVQGQGLGSAVLIPGIQEAERALRAVAAPRQGDPALAAAVVSQKVARHDRATRGFPNAEQDQHQGEVLTSLDEICDQESVRGGL
ncbi:hypothetical protein [Streptomyces sp. NBC_01077]|uniref:hypothetical protein n=1 Tax=Streptomyces sp. NBC_01077 TaxID=2903746 RepID=UPI0038667CBD